MTVALTSRIAYKRISGSKKRITQHQKVLLTLHRAGSRGLTRNELAEISGIRLSSITARVNELIDKKLVEDTSTPKRKCKVTHELGKVVKLTARASKAIQSKLSA